MNNTKILVVEDDMIIAADISMQLNSLGYEVTGIIPRGEDALRSIESTRPDIVIMDITLKGKQDGIETAIIILDTYQLPVIFLTANSDDATFKKAKTAKPYAFITKPFRKSDLQRALELTLERLDAENKKTTPSDDSKREDPHFVLSDRIFVRHKNQLVKVFLQDILFAEADRNYCRVHTKEKEYLLTLPLREFEENLPPENFMRTHRSFLVNLPKIDALIDNQETIVFGKKTVPISRRFKEAVIKRLPVI